MEFKREIRILENTFNYKTDYITSLGTTEVLLTSLETTDKINKDGSITPAEPYATAIVRYVASYTDSSYFIKLRDIDLEEKEYLKNYISDNAIKLVIDVIGVNSKEDFDIQIKPLNNIDYTIIKELEEAFKEQYITKIETHKSENNDIEIDIIQLEINKQYHDIENPENIEKVCLAIEKFIKMYTNYTN